MFVEHGTLIVPLEENIQEIPKLTAAKDPQLRIIGEIIIVLVILYNEMV